MLLCRIFCSSCEGEQISADSGIVQGLLNGTKSREYQQIMLSKTGEAVYAGPSVPVTTGSLIQTFRYRHMK